MSTIFGTSGNDPWSFSAAPAGSFVLDGLGGIDSLDFGTTLKSSYTITKAADGGVHVDSVSGASSALHGVLYNMEILTFNKGKDTVDLTTYFGVTNHSPTGSVAIAGTVTQGQVLTATHTLADADGLGVISYQWKAGGVNISGATSSSFTLTEAQVGKAITVSASYTDLLGTAESVLSSATVAVVNLNDAPTGSVAIAGTVTQGQILTASNSLADADGIGTVSYQWKAAGVAISGGTSSSFTLTEAQVGKAITVAASYTDGHGTAESVLSSATIAVVNVNDAPTGSVAIAGAVTQGQILTASNSLADLDGMGAVSYQWKAAGVAISGATSSSFTLTEAQVGKAITVAASYTDGHGTAESVLSSATVEVVNVNDVSTGSVAIAGTVTQGQILTASNSLADLDGMGVVSYQWKAAGVAISGATSSSFTLTEAQVGKAVTVAASYTDGHGTAESLLSSATAAVVNVNDPGYVSYSGTLALGQTLTAFVSDADGLGTVSYQWLAGGVAVNGATSSTFIMTAAQVGQAMTVAASYIDGHGTPEAVTGGLGLTVNLQAYDWDTHALLDSVGLSAGSRSTVTDSTGAAAFAAVTDSSLALTASRPVSAAEASATSQAVNLQDAIAILKMIVGLDVNGTGKPLSPYQAYAADFNGNGKVELSDAIAVLKHVVGLDAPTPQWVFFNEADTTVPTKASLTPGTVPVLSADLTGAGAVHVGLVGVLLGDVDGSYAGPTGAPVLATKYFTDLSTQYHLNLSQFGIYAQV